MKSETVDLARLAETIEGLRRDVGRLGERVAALEAAAMPPPAVPVPAAGTSVSQETKNDRAAAKAPAPAAAMPAPPAAAAEGLSEELLLVIASAIAAFLGK